ncbi:MAG: methyltransferase domain-containing protein [Candidatus Altiarchaeales archaeon]|nr:methyltransferase domain-containing protein [Candidatus Altiarchaeales archaeon]MBD3415649.1 methyltransferase domain-containing protein [Candidatus Altiarchaeales archaeon]
MMIETECCICGKKPYEVLWESTFDPEEVDETLFSARRAPDRVHYRMVKCVGCGLVYSNPILEPERIEELYSGSAQNYDDLVENISSTYIRYLERASGHLERRENLLEVGCGSGFFMKASLDLGFKNAYGVEPSREAVSKAPPDIRENITVDVLREGQFRRGFFDIICFFQVLDHVLDPNDFLSACREYLREEGIVLCITHDTRALSARLLGRSSPIVDIEHIYLFDRENIRRLFEKNGYEVLDVFPVKNTYSMSYWARLTPIPTKIKEPVMKLLEASGIGKANVSLCAGNLGIIAKKSSFKQHP